MSKKRGAFLEVGIWLLFVLLLVPVGFVGWIVGRDSAPAATRTVTVTAGSAAAAPDWSLPNGDLANTRVTHGSSITAANVSQLGVAWTTPLTASSIYGTFAADPAIANGVVYLQDLDSNVWASDLRTGRVLWRRDYNQKSIGPNGVTYADGVVYGAATGFAFALDAKTGRELWRNTTLVPKAKQAAGGELASGFGIDIQPQVAGGKVYLSTAALLGGGIAYALDAKTGKTLWSFDTAPDPVAKKIIAGGAWNAPAIAPNGSVYFGLGNMYQPYSVAVSHPSARHYVDSTVALDGSTGKLRWYYQAVPNDFYDWDMQLSPVLTQSGGRDVVLDAGKMGYVYEFDAATGKLLWRTKVGVHNGHDQDSLLALHHKLKLDFPLTVEPGIVGGVETNMSVADGVAYVPIADLASTYAKPTTGLGAATFGNGKGEMVALDVTTGRILWDTKLSQMADGDATVVNDLVFTTTFDGRLLALDRKTGKVVWNEKLPAFTNAPIAVSGDTLVTAASYPGGKGQIPEVIAFRIGAHGSFKPASAPGGGAAAGGTVDGKAVFVQNCSSCHTLAAANAKGAVGPNLDQLKPSAATVKRQVTNGGGGMPSFGGRLSPKQIDAVATYVASNAGRKP
ncbi:MAG: PQQ-binding-like beta-propeller repeat protein [Actinobacteria bacterium]|nr:PQQ-binding-like beta-propeller repeat protein [Actinomycetota bacterium]